MSPERYSKTERVGVNEVEKIVLNELGWIFREQPIADMGIDAHIEKVDECSPTGKLLALQIKTGLSHFHETEDGLTYYGELAHLDYWTGHSLPVVLVAHLPTSSQTLWALVNETSVRRTKKGWKIEILKSNVFGRKTIESLAEIFEGPPAHQRFRKLSIDEPLMRHIEQGNKVSVSLEEWVNKSLRRTPVRVFVYGEDGEETLSREWFQLYTRYNIKELTEALFPWANVAVDLDYYDLHEDLEYSRYRHMRPVDVDENDDVISEIGDSDTLYPYSEDGEVETYRLELSLNDLGKSFLIVSSHLGGGVSSPQR